MHNYVHIQIGVPDLDDAAEFYTKVFNWKVTKHPAMLNVAMYVPDPDGDQVGGAFRLTDEPPSMGTAMLYINTNRISEHLNLIKENGGKIVMDKTPLPGENGFIARFSDPFGNIHGLWSEETHEEE